MITAFGRAVRPHTSNDAQNAQRNPESMRWAKTSLRNSFFGWLAHETAGAPSERLEDIRKAMLALLEQDFDGKNSAIERKVLFAFDVDALWYLRPDLMTAIAETRGESVARACLADVTRLFDAGAGGKLQRERRSGPPRR